jgi:ATP-binding cassette, subfamily B, bacterial HlyB/CyaB
MQETVGGRPAADTGLESLSLLRFDGVAADAAQTSHRFCGAPDRRDRDAAMRQGIQVQGARRHHHWTRLIRLSPPAIVRQRDGTFIILAKVTDEQALIQAPSIGRPQLVGRAEFEVGWSGLLAVIARPISDVALAEIQTGEST